MIKQLSSSRAAPCCLIANDSQDSTRSWSRDGTGGEDRQCLLTMASAMTATTVLLFLLLTTCTFAALPVDDFEPLILEEVFPGDPGTRPMLQQEFPIVCQEEEWVPDCVPCIQTCDHAREPPVCDRVCRVPDQCYCRPGFLRRQLDGQCVGGSRCRSIAWLINKK